MVNLKNKMESKTIKGIARIIRPEQWYKNLVIFLALIFSLNLFNPGLFWKTFAGFIALILVSSANYVLNDLFDESKDRLCPDKQDRPLVCKSIGRKPAFILFLFLLVLSFFVSYSVNVYLFFDVLVLFLSSSLYTLYFKNIAFLDFISISLNFVLRVLAGSFIIAFPLGIGIISGTFVLSCFLVLCKRYGEKTVFGERDAEYKPVLKYYSKRMLAQLIIFFLVLLIFLFVVFSLIYSKYHLFWQIPIFAFILLRYYHLVMGRKAIVTPDRALNDKYLLIFGIMFLISSVLLINYL